VISITLSLLALNPAVASLRARKVRSSVPPLNVKVEAPFLARFLLLSRL
jgi:hypothetical protein